jgi:hypothetical protein
MTTETLKALLMEATERIGWKAVEVREFTFPTFRTRPVQPDIKPIDGLFGLRLGDYPAIVGPIQLDSVDGVTTALKKLHAQMVVARSYMSEREVINSHLFLCATSPTPTGDWRRLVDLVERDETVCRKVIWIPKQSALQDSFDAFLARTFLAMPWVRVETVSDAPLDKTYGLAERALQRHGLSQGAAHRWVALAGQLKGDADSLVTELVEARKTLS